MFTDNIGQGFFIQPQGQIPDSSNLGGGNLGVGPGSNGGGGIYGMPPSNQQSRRNTNMGDQQKKTKVFAPVTLKMVQQSQPRPDDQCEYDGDTINDIIIVGRLLKRIEEPMRTQFEINDNTCSFHVLFYHKGENQVPTALKNFVFEQFSYVKIYGNIRVFKEEKAIVGTHIKRIEKFDEVSNHFLSVFLSHCIRKKGILKPRELSMDTSALNNLGPQAVIDQHQQPMQIDQQNFYPPSGGNLHNQRQHQMPPTLNGSNMSDDELRNTIFNMMKQLMKKSKFAHKEELRVLTDNICNNDRFEKALNKLQQDGLIVQAHDNNSFCIV